MALHERQWFAEQGAARNRKLEIEANSINLPAFLANHGYKVKRESTCNDYGVSDTPVGSFGLKFKDNVWLAYQDAKDGFTGNAVMLLQYINGCGKKTAIQDILGNSRFNPSVRNNAVHIAHSRTVKSKDIVIKIPRTSDIVKGKLYLASRGIDIDTFEYLRQIGSAEYAWNGISFIGKRKDGNPKLLETRLFKPLESEDKAGEFTNHLAKGDRQFCVLIPGSEDYKEVAIVEGNIDGLALYEMNIRNLPADKQPLIIINGGKDNLKMIENPDIVALLAMATSIISWGDNETLDIDDLDDPRFYPEALKNKQAATDQAHLKRNNAIRIINATATIEYQKPPVNIHDLADWNNHIKSIHKARKLKF